MAIFRKAEPQPQKPRDRATSSSRSAVIDGAISIVGAGMLVVGDIVTEGTVRIEGEVRGTVRAGKTVILGQGGVIEGDLVTENAVIGGSVRGTIVANQRLELQSTCVVEGHIKSRPEQLKLDEGARFTGQIEMVEDDAIESPSKDAPSGRTTGYVSAHTNGQDGVGAMAEDLKEFAAVAGD
jgi:cytoskeletal protein CcmA (bactofilin family)